MGERCFFFHQDLCVTSPPYHSIGLLDTISLITSLNSWGQCRHFFFSSCPLKSYRDVEYLELNDNEVEIIVPIIY